MDIKYHIELGIDFDELVCVLKRNVVLPVQQRAKERCKAFELTNSERYILGTLHFLKGRNIKELATAAGLSYSATSKLVCGMEEMGFVERYEDISDRRNTKVRLSKAGEDMVNETDAVTAEISMGMINAKLSDEEQIRLMSCVKETVKILTKCDLTEF